MKKQFFFYSYLISISLIFNSCCTIFSGSKQRITINSNQPGATIKVDDKEVGTVPQNTLITKKKSHVIQISKEGYRSQSYTLTPNKINLLSMFNFFSLYIGTIIDAHTGALMSFSTKNVNLDLVKVPAKINGSVMVVCDKANIRMVAGATVGNYLYNGSAYKPIYWQNTVNVGVEDFQVLVNNELEDLGFSVPFKETDGTFSDRSPKVEIQAEIKDMKYDILTTAYEKNTRCTMIVTWKMRKTSNSDVIYEAETQGTSLKQEEGGSAAIMEAFDNSLLTMLGDQKVYDLLALKKNAPVVATSLIQMERPIITVHSGSYEAIAKSYANSVVTVSTTLGHGSGFIVSADGYIVTNNHVVSGNTKVNITFSNGFSFIADVVRTNEEADLALLKISGSGFTAVPLMTDSLNIQPGADVIAIGTPIDKSLGQTVTKGIISGQRIINDRSYIQTDVSINPGNSGGPLIDKNGKVIGVVTAKIAGNNTEGIGFVIPATEIPKALNIEFK
jgi:hypothetical protein